MKKSAERKSTRKSLLIELPSGSSAKTPENVAPSFIVGIGASAGGLEALEHLLKAMPMDTGMAFVVIQHLSPDFKSLMNELLTRYTSMPIHVVDRSTPVSRNCVYLLPPRKDMVLSGNTLNVRDRPLDQHLNMPINTFFRSLAQEAGERAIAVILSGTGTDGSAALLDVHAMGGLVVVQSEESAKFDGMPKAAIETGLADAVLPPEEIPEALVAYGRDPSAPVLESKTGRVREDTLLGLPAIIEQLRQRFNLDFTSYKPATVCRRIERRITLRNCASLQDYSTLAASEPSELDTLYRDLLIGVTRFFRDTEVWESLRKQVVLPLIQSSDPAGEIRVWVAACATGEEAYTIAILFAEALSKLGVQRTVRIFATDVHAHSLQLASEGLYQGSSLHDVSSERRDRYFSRQGRGYRIHPDIRKMLIFSAHNVIKDPPFTKMDLVSCRNMLIYFLPAAQGKALSSFHFALNLRGTLVLGPSESPGPVADEFETIDRQWKIYRKVQDSRLPMSLRMNVAPSTGTTAYRTTAVGDLRLARAYEFVLAKYTPSGILLNEKREILHVFGDAHRFLRAPAGKMTNDVFSLVQEDLRIVLSSAVQTAGKKTERVVFKGVRYTAEPDSKSWLVDVCVDPLPDKTTNTTYYFVFFDREKQVLLSDGDAEQFRLDTESQSRIRHLEEELQQTKQSLQTIVEELQTSNEELQATNEELMASNEELQSTNEELHSVNEELYSVNAEHEQKIKQLTEATNDLNNLMNSTEIGTIFLDRNHCIRLFTPAAAQMFNLLPQDIGRDIKHITYRVRGDDIFHAIEVVGNAGNDREISVVAPNGKSYLRRVKPYLDESRAIAGIVLTFVDVSDLITTQRQLRLTEFAVNNSSSPTYWAEKDGRIIRVNAAASELLGFSPETLLSMNVHEIHPWLSGAAWQVHWNQLRDRQQMHMDTELRHRDGRIFPVEMDLNYFSFEGEEYWFVFVRDITERRRVERILARSEQLFRSTFMLATVGIVLVTLDGQVAEANERFCKFLGYEPEQIVNRSLFDIIHEDDRLAEQDLLAKARVRDLREYEFDRRFIRRDGRVVWGQIHGTGAVVEGLDGSEPRLLRVVVDITDRKRIADALKESEERSRLLIENAPQAVVMVDPDGEVMLINSKAEELFGYARDDVVGQSEAVLIPDRCREECSRLNRDIFGEANAAPVSLERQMTALRKGGAEFPIEMRASKISMGGKSYIFKMISDVSRRMSDDRAMKDSLIEKETLLKEIHHRVKNNLQLISSLLRLQSDHFQNADHPALRECEQRVKAMALIHEKLYQAKSLARVDFAEYLTSLTTMLIHAYGTGRRVIIALDVPPIELGVDAAIPMALMLNELIANSLKHGFPGDRAGKIGISLREDHAGLMELLISDDGVGFPADFSMEQSTSLGLHLVRILAGQLHARLSVGNTGRTEFRITFEKPIMTGRSFP
jgi:two-component system CheB/CheR fusion protein